MNKKPNTQKEVRKFLEVVEAAAEIALTFYRALIKSGANNLEAVLITRAYLSSFSIPTNNSTTEGDN